MRALKIVNERRNVAAGLVNVRLPPSIYFLLLLLFSSLRGSCVSANFVIFELVNAMSATEISRMAIVGEKNKNKKL